MPTQNTNQIEHNSQMTQINSSTIENTNFSNNWWWIISFVVSLIVFLIFSNNLKEAIQWIGFNIIYFGLAYYVSKTEPIINCSGEKFIGASKRLLNSLIIMCCLFSSLALYSFFTGFLIKEGEGQEMSALFCGIFFFVMLIFLIFYMRNVHLVISADSESLEYSNFFGRKYNFKWIDIIKISFSKDGYNSLIIKTITKKIKINPFWSGQKYFFDILSKGASKEVLKEAGII